MSLVHIATHPGVVADWTTALTAQHGDPLMMVALSPAGVPQARAGHVRLRDRRRGDDRTSKGDPGETEADPAGRIRGTKRLLATAAAIMSVFLVASSFVTTLLIPPAEFEPGGDANGRALAYLAHDYLGNAFGTVYDVCTIAILWFAGASAMAGLLNLIPQLPAPLRDGTGAGRAPYARWCWCSPRSPSWSPGSSTRMSNAQGGAYATGVLVLFTSAGAAVTLAARRAGQHRLSVAFAVITVVFVYTTVDNVIERPDGVKIGACFIARS